MIQNKGNIRKVVKSDGTVVQQTAYYPFGGLYVGSTANTGSDVQTHKYNGKELDRLHGLDLYDYGARQYDPTMGQFLTIDPLAEKYYHLTPYSYCGGDPVNAVDPDGRHIEVQAVSEYQYKIVGGSANKDMNVYVDYGTKNQRSIGTMLTKYSFMDDNGKAVIGAIIDMSDHSGSNFIYYFIHNSPDLLSYILNAKEWEKYDFKRTNGRDIPVSDRANQSETYLHRGMEITLDGETFIASARDIGNFAAGYMAGINDIPWGVSRIPFDMLETWQHEKDNITNRNWQQINWHQEGKTTQYSQAMGYIAGQGTLQARFTSGIKQSVLISLILSLF